MPTSGRQSEITVFSFEYPPMVGGIGRLVSELVRGLRIRDLPVTVLTQAHSTQGLNHADSCQVAEVMTVTCRRPQRELAAWTTLRKTAQRDTVISGIWYPEGFLAHLAGIRRSVVLAHGLELMPCRARWRRGLWSRLMRTVLESANLVVANSRYTQGLVQAVAPESRVVGIPLGVDIKRFFPGDRYIAKAKFGVKDKRVILSVSRLSFYKGHDTVLHALASLTAFERENILYLVAGSGEAMCALQNEAERLGVGDNIRWLGYVPEQDLADLYRAADLFVLCSKEDPKQQEVEGFGLVFLEAQASGVPVVGTRTGGIPDAVKEGQGGWLIRQGDVAGLVSIFRRLLDYPEEFETAGKLAWARVKEEATWDIYVQRFIRECEHAGIPIG